MQRDLLHIYPHEKIQPRHITSSSSGKHDNHTTRSDGRPGSRRRRRRRLASISFSTDLIRSREPPPAAAVGAIGDPTVTPCVPSEESGEQSSSSGAARHLIRSTILFIAAILYRTGFFLLLLFFSARPSHQRSRPAFAPIAHHSKVFFFLSAARSALFCGAKEKVSSRGRAPPIEALVLPSSLS